MASLGELFVQLGVIGDTTELKKANNLLKEANKLLDERIQKETNLSKQVKKYFNSHGDERKKMREQLRADIETERTSRKLAAVGSNIRNIVGGVIALGTALTGATLALDKMVSGLAKANQEWINFLKRTDIGFNALNKYANVAQTIGSNIDMGSTLENLQQKIFDLQLTGNGAEDFLMAGINPIGQNAEGIIEQLRSRIQGMDNTTASYLLQRLGISPEIIPMLRMTAEEFNAIATEMEQYSLTEDQRKEIGKYNIQLQMVHKRWEYIRETLALKLMPIAIRLNKFTLRLIDHLSTICGWIFKALNFVTKCKNEFESLIRIIEIGLLAIGLAYNPILTGFTLLFLILEDIATYFEGGDSYAGDFMQWLKELQDMATPEWLKELQKLNNKELVVKYVDTKNNLDGKTFREQFLELLPIFTVTFIRAFKDSFSKDDKEKFDKLSYIPPSYDINNERSFTNTTNNNGNITQTNYIQTTESANEVQNTLAYAQIAMGYA